MLTLSNQPQCFTLLQSKHLFKHNHTIYLRSQQTRSNSSTVAFNHDIHTWRDTNQTSKPAPTSLADALSRVNLSIGSFVGICIGFVVVCALVIGYWCLRCCRSKKTKVVYSPKADRPYDMSNHGSQIYMAQPQQQQQQQYYQPMPMGPHPVQPAQPPRYHRVPDNEQYHYPQPYQYQNQYQPHH